MTEDLKKIITIRRPILRILFFLFFDIALISLAVFLAFFLRFEGNIPSEHSLHILGMIVLTLLVSIPVFYFSRLYSFVWLYVSANELVSLIRAASLTYLALGALFFLLRDNPYLLGFPRC